MTTLTSRSACNTQTDGHAVNIPKSRVRYPKLNIFPTKCTQSVNAFSQKKRKSNVFF